MVFIIKYFKWISSHNYTILYYIIYLIKNHGLNNIDNFTTFNKLIII